MSQDVRHNDRIIARYARAYRRAVVRAERIGKSLSRAEDAMSQGNDSDRRRAHHRTWEIRYRNANYLEYRARIYLFAALDADAQGAQFGESK